MINYWLTLKTSLNKMLLDLKETARKNTVDFSETDFIFGGKKPLPRTTIDRKKDEAVRKSGVKRIRIHDFRHSHASILITDGMNIVSVSKRLGHSDVNMTLKVYTHLINKKDEKLLSFLEDSSHKSSH